MSRARDLADSADLNFDDGTLVIDSGNNRVGIGTASPATPLHIRSAADTEFTIETTNVTADGRINFRNSAGTDIGRIYYNTPGNRMMFFTDSTERMRIDSSGNLLVGKTALDTTNTGIVARANGRLWATASGDSSVFNRTSSDGSIIELRKDNTTVGSIGAIGGDLYIGEGTVNLRFDGENARIFPASTAGAPSDASLDLGADTVRFKDLYLSGGVYLGGTGSANKLDDIDEGTWTAVWTPSTSGSITLNSSTHTCRYLKINGMVFVNGFISVSSISSPVGLIKMTGLPFAADSNQQGSLAMMVNNSQANVANFVSHFIGSRVDIYLGDAGGVQGDSAQALYSNTDMRFSGFYYTAS